MKLHGAYFTGAEVLARFHLSAPVVIDERNGYTKQIAEILEKNGKISQIILLREDKSGVIYSKIEE